MVLPRAESTATTRLPCSRAATIRRAARLMSSAPATEVPPNFITTISPVAGTRRLRIRSTPGAPAARLRDASAHTQLAQQADISFRYMELSPTAYVILGMLGWRPMSGYEIKSLVDKSTRLFWAASYGQIYPELRRLAEAGPDRGQGEPAGRPEAQRLPADAGGAQGAARLARRPTPRSSRYATRALLKLFFADASGGRIGRGDPGGQAPPPRTRSSSG